MKTLEPYGVAMLSLYPFDGIELHEMHSLMQRNALYAQIRIHDQKVSIPSFWMDRYGLIQLQIAWAGSNLYSTSGEQRLRWIQPSSAEGSASQDVSTP